MLTHPYQYAWHHFWPCKCADLGELNPLLTLKPVCRARDTGIACFLLLGASLVFLNGLSCYRSIIYGLLFTLFMLYSCFSYCSSSYHTWKHPESAKIHVYTYLYFFLNWIYFNLQELLSYDLRRDIVSNYVKGKTGTFVFKKKLYMNSKIYSICMNDQYQCI